MTIKRKGNGLRWAAITGIVFLCGIVDKIACYIVGEQLEEARYRVLIARYVHPGEPLAAAELALKKSGLDFSVSHEVQPANVSNMSATSPDEMVDIDLYFDQNLRYTKCVIVEHDVPI